MTDVSRTRSPLVVYSPTRWDYSWQRPQQVLSRMATRRPVWYVEEPCYDPHPMPRWELRRERPGLMVCRPHTPVRVPGFSPEQHASLRRLMRDLFIEQGLDGHVAWLYSPSALALAHEFAARLVVYDSPGETARFLETPPDFAQREHEVLARADLVFSECPIDMPRGRDARLHELPGGVDVAHFARARNGIVEAEDQRRIPGPRLGFFGVVDDRIDAELLDGVAEARPEWSLVMLGHVARRDPVALPRRQNLHWLGARDFVDLPAYLCGWDVALLPMFTHEAGRPVGGMRALEYMAAGRPVVSTPIPDLLDDACRAVRFGRSVDEFVAACENLLGAGPEERAEQMLAMDAVLRERSWDATVGEMDALLCRYEDGYVPRVSAAPAPERPRPDLQPDLEPHEAPEDDEDAVPVPAARTIGRRDDPDRLRIPA